MAIPASVLVALKSAAPGKTDQELVDTYNEVKRLAPQIDTLPPDEVAKKILNLRSGAGVSPAISTKLPSPYAGTEMEKRMPATPGAAFINQFDPEQLKAAYEDYARRYAATAGQRELGQGLAAAAGPEALRASQESWNKLDEQNRLMSLERQKALQEQATSGLAAATTAQNMAKTAGEYEMAKLKGIQELETAQFGVDQLRRMNDPTSTETTMAKLMLADQLRFAGVPDTAIKQLVDRSGVTAQQLAAFMDPKVLDAYKKKIGVQGDVEAVRKARAEADIGEAVAGSMVTPASGAKPAPTPAPTGERIPPEVQTERDRERLRILQQELNKPGISEADRLAVQREILRTTSKNPALAGVPPRSGATLAAPAGAVPSISAGGVNLSFPTQQVEAQAEGERRVDLARRAEAWKNFGQPGVERVKSILNKGTYTGKGTAALASILGADDQVELLTELARLNAIYPDMFPPALSASLKQAQSEGGYSGRLLGSMSQPVLLSLLKKYEEDMNRQFASGQARSTEVNKGARSTDVPVKAAAPSQETKIRMRNAAGRTINIPASMEKEAIADGYKRI